ncbi:MAG: hypothetical protein HFF08_10525 [Oscillospiraceae bacterium]|nr:hypothetical protein [Oscillospiraceae bacterium]
MNAIFIGRGNFYLGMTKVDEADNVVERTEPNWEPNAEGGCVAICDLDPDKMEPVGKAEVFGYWDAAHYLAVVLEKLGTGRPVNIPDFRAILAGYVDDTGENSIFCEYCNRSGCDCRDCIVKEWMDGL